MATTGKVIFVSGLSASGKTTLVRYALEHASDLEYFKTYTTRPKRSEEESSISVEYNFVTQTEYQQLRQQSNKWSHNEIHDNYYGSNLSDLYSGLANGKNYICMLFPTLDKIIRVKNHSDYDKKLIWIDSSESTSKNRLNQEKPIQELTRAELEKTIPIKELIPYFDYVFTPEMSLQRDCEKFNQLIKEIIS